MSLAANVENNESRGGAMKTIIALSLLLTLSGCTSDAEREEQREEAEKTIQKAEESGEDIKIDRDVIGDDEVEIE
jgi:hypothetical protein